ncbi:extracellular solute-binding protein [Sutcliffiella horikoshii]|uniref:Extracellular solute-binding protein n=1 Tax=Sutcliffiella horikoshii TaxID=79883 RepID=A0A5D4TCJ3_9BACI|nr:extracellular solute-binding protein [Sutcliffiella horikoshii]TYS71774.1 extracellular solute-binding protein [Sutcliffiella horikoshii]
MTVKKLIPYKSFIFVLILTIFISGCSSSNGTTETAAADEANNNKTLRILTNVVGGKDPEEHEKFEKEIERLTGMKVEMDKPPADYDQKLLASMSSGEKYDLVYLTKPMLDILVDQGVLTDLTENVANSKVLSDPSVIPTEEWELVKTEDGKIYGVFNKFEGGTLPTVRQDWMEKLNLSEPKTLEDFYQVLKAFKEEDPDGNGKNDTYGLSTAGLYDIQGFMSAAGVKYRYVIDENGDRTIPYATEAAVPVYEWFAKLYKEGILDPNFATNDTGKMRELFLTDRVGMVTYWDAWVGLFNNIAQTEAPDTEFEAKGIPGAVGKDGKIMLRRGDPSLWAIPVNAENQDMALDFLEFWHSEEGNILGTLGIKEHDYTMSEGKYELTDIGREHGMDHGAPFPNNTNFTNPIGEMKGVKEAQQIILDNNATVEVSTADWPNAEKIVTKYAFQAMMGEIPAKDAVKKMHQELLNANLIDK